MKKIVVLLGLVGLLLVPAAAQAQFSLGAQGNFASDNIDFGVGARAAFDFRQMNQPIMAFGTFDYFFPGGEIDYYEFNLNAAYISGVRPDLDTWVGLGLNVAIVSTPLGDTNRAGLNLLAGARYNTGKAIGLFGEFRFEVEGGELFVVTFGADYTFGK
jgi:hypothetical protein